MSELSPLISFPYPGVQSLPLVSPVALLGASASGLGPTLECRTKTMRRRIAGVVIDG